MAAEAEALVSVVVSGTEVAGWVCGVEALALASVEVVGIPENPAVLKESLEVVVPG